MTRVHSLTLAGPQYLCVRPDPTPGAAARGAAEGSRALAPPARRLASGDGRSRLPAWRPRSRSDVRRLTLAALALALAVAVPAAAQDELPPQLPVPVADVALDDAQVVDPPAHVSLVEGTVVLERDGRPDTSPSSMPILAGDRLRTRDGRAEVLFADGSTLHLDHETIVDFQSDEVMRLLAGRVRVNIPGAARDVSYRIDAPAAWVQIDRPGAYRVSIFGVEREAEIELAVVRGVAEIATEHGRTLLRAGERAVAREGLAPSEAYVFNSAAWDEFDHWSEARRGERLGVSAEYLPEEVRPYAATLVHYGAWRHEPTYGYVWYPRVQSGWRPYYHGRWSRLRPWGWTWIAADPWGWPTHHFGRWGFSAGVWFWIPGKRWGPAWVSWAHAPGYVSWCPLGWDNRPVFFFNTRRHFRGRYYDPWHAWTVVPHRRFGTGFVNVNVVNVTNIDVRTRRAFVPRSAGPEIRGYAVPRSDAPIRVAGTRLPGPAGSVEVDRRAGDAGARAAFRSQRPQVEPRNGQALPAPSRVPRPSATMHAAPAPADAPAARSRSGSSVVAGPGEGVRRAQPRSGVPSGAPRASDAPSRRAAPESRTGPSSPRGSDPAPDRPARRAAPEYRAAPSAPRAGNPTSDAPARRAVPRNSGAYRPVPSPGAPGPQSDTIIRRSPGSERPGRPDASYGAPRAMPRPGRGDDSPPPSYRPAPRGGDAPRSYRPPAVERRAPEARPSSPGPSAAPARPSGPSRSAAPPSNRGSGSRDSGGARSRPSGGNQPRGTARPRG